MADKFNNMSTKTMNLGVELIDKEIKSREISATEAQKTSREQLAEVDGLKVARELIVKASRDICRINGRTASKNVSEATEEAT